MKLYSNGNSTVFLERGQKHERYFKAWIQTSHIVNYDALIAKTNPKANPYSSKTHFIDGKSYSITTHTYVHMGNSRGL